MERLLPSREVIAHRGASALAPEHTHTAYDLAVAQGADILELDVRATADGDLLVVHDPTLARTTGDARRVDSLTRGALAGLTPSLRPLTLDAVLERHGAAAKLLVELKDPEPHWEGLVLDAVERHGAADRVVLQSFDMRALRRLRMRAPGLPLAWLHRRMPAPRMLDAVARCAEGIGVWHHHVDAGLVAAAHARGLVVHAWTVNSTAAIRRVLAAGVDGVITDVPNVAAAAVKSQVPRTAAAGPPARASSRSTSSHHEETTVATPTSRSAAMRVWRFSGGTKRTFATVGYPAAIADEAPASESSIASASAPVTPRRSPAKA